MDDDDVDVDDVSFVVVSWVWCDDDNDNDAAADEEEDEDVVVDSPWMWQISVKKDDIDMVTCRSGGCRDCPNRSWIDDRRSTCTIVVGW